MSTRREFMQTLGLLGAAALLPVRSVLARLQAGELTVAKLRDNAWHVTGGGGNVLLLRTPEGPILCDAKVPTVAEELRDHVREHAASLPKILINTHHHADHTGGNDLLGEDATVIAHRNLAPRMRANLNERFLPALRGKLSELKEAGNDEEAAALAQRIEKLDLKRITPDKEVDGEMELTFGGVKLQLLHYGPAHTDNDIILFLPELNILHTGDLVFHELHPYIDRPAGATTVGWQHALDRMGELCKTDTLVIPGHGELTDPTGLKAMHAYFDQMRAFVKEQIAAGKSRDDISAMRPEAFKDRGFERMLPVVMNVLYDELTVDDAG